MAVEKVRDARVIMFMTQDALLADEHAIDALTRAFDDDKVAAAYGRQLPRAVADPIEAHARLFNYADASRRKRLSDADALGIKTAFLSNSFAAYRTSDLIAIGNFPTRGIFGEDMHAAARLLMAGREIQYVAEARVFHSHGYRLEQELKRSFDIGAFHALTPWLLREFGEASGEGRKFVVSELRYLLDHSPTLLPSAIARSVAKYLGYRLGRLQGVMPPTLKRRLSMSPRFWA